MRMHIEPSSTSSTCSTAAGLGVVNSLVVMAMLSIGVLDSASAQGILDDFSANSLRYALFRPDDVSRLGSARYTEHDLRLVARADDTTPDELRMTIADSSDTLIGRMALDSGSESQSPFGLSGVRLVSVFFNDTGDASSDGGDIQTSVSMFVKGNGERGAQFCIQRNTADGSIEALTAFNGAFCERIEGFIPRADVEYALGLRLDRGAKTLTMSIGNHERSVDFSGPFFVPSTSTRHVDVFQEGGPGIAIADIGGIKTDTFNDVFATSRPLFPGYAPAWDLYAPGLRALDVVDEHARFVVQSTGGNERRSISLRAGSGIDHLEGRITLSGESVMAPGSSIGATVNGIFYRDSIPDQDAEASLKGSIYAAVQARIHHDGRQGAQYCLGRYAGSEVNSLENLLDPEMQCLPLDVDPEIGVTYAASLSLDRAGMLMHFQFGGDIRSWQIDTPILDAPRAFHNVQVNAQGDARAVAYLDDLRTSPTTQASTLVSDLTSPVISNDPVRDDPVSEPPASDSPQSPARAPMAIEPIGASSNGNGSGCSIGPDRFRADPLFPLCMAIASVILYRRKIFRQGAAANVTLRQNEASPQKAQSDFPRDRSPRLHRHALARSQDQDRCN